MHIGLAGLGLVSLMFLPILATAGTSAPTRRTCDDSAMPDCEKLSTGHANAALDRNLGIPFPRDGGFIFNSSAWLGAIGSTDAKLNTALRSDLADFAKPTTRSQLSRFEKAAETARRAAIAVIANGVAERSWNSEQRTLIQRLKTVPIIPAMPGDESCGLQNGPLGFPNAAYQPELHRILICPGTYKLTASQVVNSIGHELGHVVEGCNETSTLYKVDQDNVYPGPFKEYCRSLFYDKKGNEIQINDHVVRIMLERPEYVLGEADPEYVLGEADPEIYKKLEACGAIKKVPDPSFAIPSLMSKTQSCLARVFAKPYETFLNQRVQGKIATEHVQPAEARKIVQTAKPAYCLDQPAELFADAFSGQVLSRVGQDSNWKDSDYQVAVLQTQGYACYERKAGFIETDDHPAGQIRLRTLLGTATAASALNCEISSDPKMCPLSVSTSEDKSPHDHKSATSGAPKKANGTR